MNTLIISVFGVSVSRVWRTLQVSVSGILHPAGCRRYTETAWTVWWAWGTLHTSSIDIWVTAYPVVAVWTVRLRWLLSDEWQTLGHIHCAVIMDFNA